MEYIEERKIDLKLIIAIIAVGMMSFTGVVVETAMNVTFPTLMKEFNVNTSTVQWITTGYLLVLAMIIPVSSFLKQRFKTKSLFITAILFFIVGVICDAVTPNFGLLLLGRLIQGVGTGIALPLMFNIVLEQVPLNKLGMMMGVASLITAIAPAIGPSLGGLIVNQFGWRMIFVVLLPLLVVSFFMGILSIRQVKPIQRAEFDWKGYLFLAVSFSCIVFATSSAGVMGWGSIQVIILFLISVITIVLFSLHSRNMDNPIINLKVFSNKSFLSSVIGLLFIQFICLGLGFLIPNYAQLVSDENAFVSGCLLLPGCIIGALMTPFGGRLLDKFGAKKPIIAGNLCIIFSTMCFSIFAKDLTSMLFVFFYFFFALGQSFSVGNTMTNGLKRLPEKLKADGNAVINTLQQLAGAIGTSVVTTIVAASQAVMPENSALATMVGSKNAFLLLSILAVIVLVSSLCALYKPNLN